MVGGFKEKEWKCPRFLSQLLTQPLPRSSATKGIIIIIYQWTKEKEKKVPFYCSFSVSIVLFFAHLLLPTLTFGGKGGEKSEEGRPWERLKGPPMRRKKE